MKRTAILAAALAVVSVSVSAQETAAVPDDAETRGHAVQYLQVLFSALSSENVDEEVKDVLMGCIYGNTMQDITVEMDKAIDANGQVDRENPTQVLGVMAGVCGYRPPDGQAPQTQAPATEGR